MPGCHHAVGQADLQHYDVRSIVDVLHLRPPPIQLQPDLSRYVVGERAAGEQERVRAMVGRRLAARRSPAPPEVRQHRRERRAAQVGDRDACCRLIDRLRDPMHEVSGLAGGLAAVVHHVTDPPSDDELAVRHRAARRVGPVLVVPAPAGLQLRAPQLQSSISSASIPPRFTLPRSPAPSGRNRPSRLVMQGYSIGAAGPVVAFSVRSMRAHGQRQVTSTVPGSVSPYGRS